MDKLRFMNVNQKHAPPDHYNGGHNGNTLLFLVVDDSHLRLLMDIVVLCLCSVYLVNVIGAA